MSPTPPQTVTVLANPYAAHGGISTVELEVMLLCAVVMLCFGLLLISGRRVRSLF